MARFFYSLLFYVATPFILFRLWRRARQAPAYGERIAERFGFFKAPRLTKPVVWIHTVSVGEFIGAQPVIKALLAHDKFALVVTTMTPTGSAQVKAALGDKVFHVYAPYDTPSAVSRFLRKLNPCLLISMETELWPNTIAACHARGIKTLLINARLSEKSARGYYKARALTRPMLSQLDAAAIQNNDDAARFERLGLDRNKVTVTGNIKFDLTLTDIVREKAQQIRAAMNVSEQRPVWIAASTHKGEDEIILVAFSKLKVSWPKALLVLVPRHPERFDSVHVLCNEAGFVTDRRSANHDYSSCDILLGDTMGELVALYGASDIAFVGGSLVATGGHNFIEAAAWGLPLISGPHLFNFAEVARLLTDKNALVIAPDELALAKAVEVFFADPALRTEKGQIALGVANENRGALARALAFVETHLPT